MKNNILFSIFTLLCCYASQIYGQMDTPAISAYSRIKNFSTPDVTSLGTYGIIPVSLFTGTPDVMIPVYEIKLPDITVPVTLRYNINNVKPNNHPGSTGLGWNLICGGNITRIQKGYFDENRNSKINLGFLEQEDVLGDRWTSYFPDYDYKYIGNNREWYSQARMEEMAFSMYDNAHTKDVMPDEFVFNFLGYSGSFSRDHTGKWQVISDTDFKVDYSVMAYSSARPQIVNGIKKAYQGHELLNVFLSTQTIQTFTLTAPDGTTFVFGGNDAIDYSVNMYNQGDKISAKYYQTVVYPVATTWHLSRIIVNGHTLFFNYQASDPVMDADFSFWMQDNFRFKNLGRGTNFQLIMPVYLKRVYDEAFDFLNFDYENSTELKYDTKYFQNWNIEFDRLDLETIDFNYISGYADIKWKELSHIVCADSMEYQLNYTHSPDERLKLTSIDKKGKKGEVETYTFAYYDDIKLPRYLSGHYDHLGFYNGVDFSRTFNEDFYGSANYETNNEWYAVSRKGDETGNYVRAEMLKSIEYPTSGKTLFQYEPHYVWNTVEIDRQQLRHIPSPMYPGGLRIKKIINYDTDGKFLNAKSYYYVDGSAFDPVNKTGNSSGILSFFPMYYWKEMRLPVVYPNLSFTRFDALRIVNLFTSSSTNQACYNLQKDFVGYTHVLECDENEAGVIKGYKENTFTNFDNGYTENDYYSIGHFDSAPITYFNDYSDDRFTKLTPMTPFFSKSRERGRILEEKYYDANKNVKKSVKYQYERFLSGTIRNIEFFMTMPGAFQSIDYFILGGAYYAYNYKYRLKEKREETYNSSIPLKRTFSYTYNQDNLVNSEKTYDQKDTYEKVTSYSGDAKFLADDSPSGKNIFTEMRTLNMLNYPVEATLYKNGNVISSTVTNYRYAYQGMFTPKRILPDTLFSLETTTPLADYQRAYVNGGKLVFDKRCKPEIIFNNYDMFGNPIFVTDRSSNTVYLWSYSGSCLIAKIENATYKEIDQLKLFRQEDSDSFFLASYMFVINMLREKLPNARVTTYGYLPWVGINRITYPNGVEESYEYDGLNRLKSVKNNDGKVVKEYNYHVKSKN